CHGPARPVALPPCGQQDPPPQAYPFRGEDYNFGHPPLYYAITGMLTRGVDAAVPGEHFITIARILGLFCLWAGLLVRVLACRRFGASGPFPAPAPRALPRV